MFGEILNDQCPGSAPRETIESAYFRGVNAGRVL
jgi:hypothetical protein